MATTVLAVVAIEFADGFRVLSCASCIATVILGHAYEVVLVDGVYAGDCEPHARKQAEAERLAAEMERRYFTTRQGRAIPHGDKKYADDDSGILWAVFPRSFTNLAITNRLSAYGWPVDGAQCHSGDYDCCGHMGARSMWIKRQGSRALARISYYRDV